MRAKKFVTAAIVGLSLAPASIASAFAGSDPKGIWLDDTGRGAVEIKSCDGSGNALCGNVVWVKSSGDADGCGKQILGNVKPVTQGHWDNGWIYSPEKGRKYDVELVPLSNGNLKVVGYAGIKFLSKTMIWTPAPQDLQLCGLTNSNKPGTTATAPSAVPPNSARSVSERPQERDANAKPAPEAKVDASAATKPASDIPAPAKSDQSPATAKADAPAPDTGKDEGAGTDLGKLKIGDLQLDKFVTKTKDGKCKLDLPWVKVTIDCEQ